MKTFFAIVHKDEDSAYGAHFPDAPGCFSAADKLEDVIANASEALELWFEDEPVVEPRSLEAVREGAADDLAEGAFIVGVPLMENSGRLMRINLSFDAHMLNAIDSAAKARRLTRSAFLAQAARNEITGRH